MDVRQFFTDKIKVGGTVTIRNQPKPTTLEKPTEKPKVAVSPAKIKVK